MADSLVNQSEMPLPQQVNVMVPAGPFRSGTLSIGQRYLFFLKQPFRSGPPERYEQLMASVAKPDDPNLPAKPVEVGDLYGFTDGVEPVPLLPERAADVAAIRGELAPGVDAAPPAVSLLEPSADGFVHGVVTFRAEATDDRQVMGVTIVDEAGSLLADEMLTPPYVLSWDTAHACDGPCDGPYAIGAKARDRFGNLGASRRVRLYVDNTPPTVSLTVTGQRQRMLTAEATDLVGVVAVEFEVDGTPIGTLTAPPYVLTWDSATVPDGPHTLRAKARDGAGNVGLSDPEEVVVDNTPPELTVAATPSVVWPPNHKLVPVSVAVSVHDAIDPQPAVRLESVTCDDGCVQASDVTGAAVGTDDRAFLLRAERSGVGAGRTYTIAYVATDASGNSRTATTTVFVPHDRRAP